MKIVEIIPSLEKRAGAEVFLINLSKSFSKENEVFVISLYDGIDDDIKQMLNVAGIKIYFCGKKVGIDSKCGRRLKRCLNQIQPNIVHMHLNCLMTFFLAFNFSKQPFSSFLTVHSLVEKDFNCIERFIIKKYLKKGLLSIVGISDLITKDIARYFKKVQIHTIYNGSELFEPVPVESKDNKQLIVCVAAFREEKNQVLLLDACHSIYSNNTKNIRLVFVGDGPTIEHVKQKASSYDGLDVNFVGHTSNVEPFLQQGTIFCLSSKYEGNPISIIEAMSIGLPVVAPRVGGIPDIVKDGINGLLFEVNNIDDCTNKLLCLINDKELRTKIRKNNIKESQKFGIDICAKKYLDIFSEGERREQKI